VSVPAAARPGCATAFLTRDVIDRLLPVLPALREVDDPARVTPAAVFGLVTVGLLCGMVERKRIGRD
jgi:hypothetical protein